MKEQVKIFESESFGKVRVTGTSDEPLFCLADVCKVLEIGNPSQVKARISDDLISNEVISDSLGRQQEMTFINEDGLYDVILDSRKPQAKAFRKWITSEVLPSIRKTGKYSVQQYEIPQTFSEALMLAAKQAKQIEDQQKQIEAKDEKIKEDEPRVTFAKAIEVSKRSCLMSELAKILYQNGVTIGRNRLFEWMREKGFLCTKGESHNQPTQKAMEQGLFTLKQTTVNKPDGSVIVTTTTKVTPRGQIYFVNRFLGHNND